MYQVMAYGERHRLLDTVGGEKAANPSGPPGELSAGGTAGLSSGTALAQGLSRGGMRGGMVHGGGIAH
jgi:hypothetical protein